MNLNNLRTFLAIAEAGTLAGAAKALGHNHSTVFRRLNAMEADMGVRLFDRLPQGYVLTSVGERLRELGNQADRSLQQIERELVGRDLAPSGRVKVTTAPNIARTILPPVVAQLRRDYPGIVVELAAGDSDYDLNRREADIALRATTSPPEHLVGRKIAELDWWLFRASAQRRAPPKQVADMAKLPLIGAEAGMMRLKEFQWLEKQFGEAIVARANDLSTMGALAAAGVGYAILPVDQTQPGLRRVLKIPNMMGQLWLLTHPDLRHVTRIKVVWDAIAAHLAGREKF